MLVGKGVQVGVRLELLALGAAIGWVSSLRAPSTL